MQKAPRKSKKKLLIAGLVLLAIVSGVLAIFIPWGANPQAQPNNIPETRVSPYGEEVPDRYGIWPTEEFTAGRKPLWVRTGLLNITLGFREFFSAGRSDSLLILHKGKLVYERYSNGFDKETPHYMASVTKSVVSALVGVAVGDGIIGGVEDKVIDYFPEAETLPGWQESKRDMTIEHLLTMTSGILADADEIWDGYFAEDQEDSALYAFLIPQTYAPGEKYQYDSIAPCILLGIIERAGGVNILAYARERLFSPLGMDSVEWETTADGLPTGGFGLDMTPRDMLRFGYLYLNYGRWEDSVSGDTQQILPADWVAKTPPRSKAVQAYGYLFWNYRQAPFSGAYEARGAGGQYIIIQPDRDLVIARTGSPGIKFVMKIRSLLGLSPTGN